MDVRMLDCSGIGTYLAHILPRLPARMPGTRFTLFGTARQARALLPGAARVPVAAPIYSVREQAVLAWAARGRGLDLFWAPHYNAPLAVGTRLAVTVHDLIHILFPEYLPRPRAVALAYARGLMRAACGRARVVLCPSEHTRRDLVRHLGVARGKITVTPLGVDAGWTPVRGAARLAAFRRRHGLGDRYCLFIGNLKPHKNLERLVRAFATLPDRGLILALAGGDGSTYTARLRGLAQELGVEGRVVFPGVLPRRDLPTLYSAASVLAFPSLYEGFGLPPLEAMACGTPVVASRASSIPEVTAGAALLVNPRDTRGLGLALRAVLERTALRRRLVARGLARARAASWDRTADRTAAALLKAAQA